MEEKILRINSMVSDSLQFAEAKNAALITFNGAALYVLIEGKEFLPPIVKANLVVLSAMLVIAISISLIAFLPIMNPNPSPSKNDIKKLKKLKDNASIFYFGHLRLFNEKQLLNTFYKYYGVDKPEKILRSNSDLATQTIMISRITWRKYVFFSIAGHLTLTTLILPVPFLVVYWGYYFLKNIRA